MSRIKGFKLIISIWCICLLVRTVVLSSIKNSATDEDTTSKLKNILLQNPSDRSSNLGDTNVPNYLLDLFETNSLFENNRILLLNNSNTIRSHPMFEGSFDERVNKSGILIKFNLTLPKNELLNAAEFRLYLNGTPHRCNRQRITIHQIIQQLVTGSALLQSAEVNRYTTLKEEESLIYRQIDSLMIEADESSWLQFDVLPAVELWLVRKATNFGLLIKSHCVNDINLNLVESDFVDNLVIRTTNSDQYDTLKPVLLTYSNFQNMDYEFENPIDFMNKKKRHVNEEEPVSAVRSRKDWKYSKKDCSIYSMYVDFKEIGWEDWILAPRGYDAGLCYGDCSLSVIRNGNATNHATMQSLSNGIQPDLVPSPCCVPIEFAPIAMVYKEGPKSSVLKVYDNMIVKKCGCK